MGSVWGELERSGSQVQALIVHGSGYRCTFGQLNLARSVARPGPVLAGHRRPGPLPDRAMGRTLGPQHGGCPARSARGPTRPVYFFSICCDFVLFLFDITCELRYVLLETMKLYAASFICCDL